MMMIMMIFHRKFLTDFLSIELHGESFRGFFDEFNVGPAELLPFSHRTIPPPSAFGEEVWQRHKNA